MRAQRRSEDVPSSSRIDATRSFPLGTPARARIRRGETERSGAKRRKHRPGEASRTAVEAQRRLGRRHDGQRPSSVFSQPEHAEGELRLLLLAWPISP